MERLPENQMGEIMIFYDLGDSIEQIDADLDAGLIGYLGYIERINVLWRNQ